MKLDLSQHKCAVAPLSKHQKFFAKPPLEHANTEYDFFDLCRFSHFYCLWHSRFFHWLFLDNSWKCVHGGHTTSNLCFFFVLDRPLHSLDFRLAKIIFFALLDVWQFFTLFICEDLMHSIMLANAFSSFVSNAAFTSAVSSSFFTTRPQTTVLNSACMCMSTLFIWTIYAL